MFWTKIHRSNRLVFVWSFLPYFKICFQLNVLLSQSHRAEINLAENATTWPGWDLKPDHAIMVTAKATQAPFWPFHWLFWRMSFKPIFGGNRNHQIAARKTAVTTEKLVYVFVFCLLSNLKTTCAEDERRATSVSSKRALPKVLLLVEQLPSNSWLEVSLSLKRICFAILVLSSRLSGSSSYGFHTVRF